MTTQDRINSYWTERAPSYDDYQQQPDRLDADRAAWESIWTDALPPAPADVLDVGTGSGYVALTLAGLGYRVTGIDLAAGMLDRARAHTTGLDNAPEFREGDAVVPAFPPGSFDAVVNRYVMWTLREPATAVANWIRLLRPGGALAVVDSTWFPNGLDSSGDGFGRWYDASVLDALPLAAATSINQTAAVLEAAGLRDVQVTPLTAILELDQQYGVALAKRFYQNRPPSILDVPAKMQWDTVNIPDPETPVGARGIGEPPVGAGLCAVLNALSDALGDEVFRRAPVTLDVILTSLEAGKPMFDPLRAHI